MALNKGNSACTSGLSKRIFDQWVADPNSGFSGTLSTPQINMIKAQIWAIAQSIVDEIVANAVVTNAGGTPTGDLVK